MKSAAILSSALLLAANCVSGSPVKRDSWMPSTTLHNLVQLNQTQTLQLAMMLENLESALYTEGLGKYNESDFENAGLPNGTRARFAQIADHEATHVSFLASVLGVDAAPACNYSFPYTDVVSFANLSGMLESVGNSAYLGSALYLTGNTTLLDAAASILSVEARHASYIYSSVLGGDPWSGAFDTPLNASFVTSLATNFTTYCPPSNVTLPPITYPNLTVSGTPQAGQSVSLTYDNSTAGNSTQYLAFFSGLNTTYANINSAQVTIPSGLGGLVFAVVTNDTSVSDGTIIAGPAPIIIVSDSNSTSNAPDSISTYCDDVKSDDVKLEHFERNDVIFYDLDRFGLEHDNLGHANVDPI
ncbi:ferritin-like domain-containing protein [Phellopilus nigrolimitatus]|nr:ferritin-like domain-containing protein [Phellopilus nigrolimitatus]